MRLAGNLPQEIIQLLAVANDESSWPSIHRPRPAPPVQHRYDEHMKEYVPNVVVPKLV
tara:strand:- start:548 stop:721 length:174 start_codon:yes stop_codon:yes gene_type:complete